MSMMVSVMVTMAASAGLLGGVTITFTTTDAGFCIVYHV